MRRERWIALGVFAATLLSFATAVGNDFVVFDDLDLVVEHPVVRHGLGLSSVAWAFTSAHAQSYVPLTVLSHLLDVSLFGLSPAGHHGTSVLLHAIAATLVYRWLRGMTGDDWRSAAVALLFGLHPLRVESVAWVSERRDVLSGVFGLAALLAWTRWATRGSARAYASACGFYALSLLSKATFVTLPLLLFVLDFWPLARRSGASPIPLRRLVVEKLPLLALAGAVAAGTLLTQRSALSAADALPLALRLENAAVSAVVYLGQLFWPVDLSVLVPHPGAIPSAKTGAAALLLGAATGLAFASRRSHPWLLSGWLWYGIALLPMAGIVQVGLQAHADRYTYVPLVGIGWALVWCVPDRFGATRTGRTALAVAAAAVALALALATTRQIGTWRNGVTLFEQAVSVTPDNAPALRLLGVALAREGRQTEAEARYREALRLRPGSTDARYDLALVLAGQGRRAEARDVLLVLLASDPSEGRAHTLFATLLAEEGRSDAALPHFEAAVRVAPEDATFRRNLGLAYAQAGRSEEAAAAFEEALRLEPDSADTHDWLGFVLAARGERDAARAHFEEALRLAPDHPSARAHLSRLGTSREAP